MRIITAPGSEGEAARRAQYMTTDQPCVVWRQYEQKVYDRNPGCWGPTCNAKVREHGTTDENNRFPVCTGHHEQLVSIGAEAFARKYFRGGYDELRDVAAGYESAFQTHLAIRRGMLQPPQSN